MMFFCKFYCVGLQLLLLTHIAHTFVLLTANMEDVKKLARKFVSDSLADKIAEFIAKATQNMGTNVSEENEPQDDTHQVSEENNMYNIERHGFESAAQEAVKSKEEITLEKEKEELSQSISEEEQNKDFEIPLQPEKILKPLEEQSRYIKAESKLDPYTYPVQPEKMSKISEEDENYEKEKEASKYLEENLISTPTTVSETFKAKPLKKKIKGRPYRLLAHLNSIEDNEVMGKLPESNDTLIDDFSGNLLFNQKRSMDLHNNVELTTGKAAYEFDQYDNKKYPKADLVAPSAPVSLLMPEKKLEDNWWEKDLPSRRHDNKDDTETRRKSWF